MSDHEEFLGTVENLLDGDDPVLGEGDLRRLLELARARIDLITGEAVNHPAHYNEHPSGVECIDIVEHMGFNLGNAVKYIWRASLKGKQIQDLEKAGWYVRREIQRILRELEKEGSAT